MNREITVANTTVNKYQTAEDTFRQCITYHSEKELFKIIKSLTDFKFICSAEDIGISNNTTMIKVANNNITTKIRIDLNSDSMLTIIFNINLTLHSGRIIIMPLSKYVFLIFAKFTYKFRDRVHVNFNMFYHSISFRFILKTIFNFFNESF